MPNPAPILAEFESSPEPEVGELDVDTAPSFGAVHRLLVQHSTIRVYFPHSTRFRSRPRRLQRRERESDPDSELELEGYASVEIITTSEGRGSKQEEVEKDEDLGLMQLRLGLLSDWLP